MRRRGSGGEGVRGMLRVLAGRAAWGKLAAVLALIVLTLPQAAVFMRNVGPYTVPDPDLHASTAYALATGQSFNATGMVRDRWGNEVRRPIVVGDERYLTGQLAYNKMLGEIITEPLRADETLGEQRVLLARPGGTVTAHPRATQYTPVAYAPQALGLRVGWMLGEGPYASLQTARLCNFACYLMLGAAAVMLLPRCRWLAVVVLTLPESCFAASSLMTDGTFLALSTLAVALVLAAGGRARPVGAAWFAALSAVSALLVFGKAVYATPALLAFALPSSVMRPRAKAGFACWLGACSLLYLAWARAYSGGFYNVDYAANTAYALGHPLKTLALVSANIAFLPRTLTAGTWSATSAALVAGVWLLACTRTRIPGGNMDGPRAWLARHRYAVTAIVAAGLSLTATVLFVALTWNDLTRTGATGLLNGIQGRYLLPLLPLLMAIVQAAGTQNDTGPDATQATDTTPARTPNRPCHGTPSPPGRAVSITSRLRGTER